MTLREVLEAAADDLEMEASVGPDGGLTWDVAGRLVATLDASGATASFRLDPVLAGAAQRTPDVAASARGAEWVEFRPAAFDGHDADRAAAWFGAASRRAAA